MAAIIKTSVLPVARVKDIKPVETLANAAETRLLPAFLHGNSAYNASGARKRGFAFKTGSYGDTGKKK